MDFEIREDALEGAGRNRKTSKRGDGIKHNKLDEARRVGRTDARFRMAASSIVSLARAGWVLPRLSRPITKFQRYCAPRYYVPRSQYRDSSHTVIMGKL